MKFSPINRYTTIIIFVVIAAFLGYFLFTKNNMNDDFKCPNDYATVEEYVDGTAKWMSEEIDKNPDLSEEEIMMRRTQKLQEYECDRSHWLG